MSKIKVKELKKTLGDVNISSLFEEMVGAKDADKQIILPKFIIIRNAIRQVYRVLMQLATFGPLKTDFPEIASSLLEIEKYADCIKESTCISVDIDDQEELYVDLSKEDMNILYKKLKENPYVKKLIVLCGELDRYKNNFNDQANLKENFVNQEPGLSFCIFSFSTLDLKLLWCNSKMKSLIKKYIVTILNNLYKSTHLIYKTITSPDIDIDQFTEILLESITQLKKQPALSRCNRAFKRIEQSVELLKNNFDSYYRESVASENPDSLITSFISDVSTQGGGDLALTREFRTIIAYMSKVSQSNGKNKDPEVKKIFAMLNKNFNLMENNFKHKSDSKSDDATDLEDLDLSTKE
jgi:hypothetical protein